MYILFLFSESYLRFYVRLQGSLDDFEAFPGIKLGNHCTPHTEESSSPNFPKRVVLDRLETRLVFVPDEDCLTIVLDSPENF